MIDANYVKGVANQNIERILDHFELNYITENGWICLPCPFHGGTKHNLKFRGDGFYCFSQCQKFYTIIDLIMTLMNTPYGDALRWLIHFLGIADSDIDIEAAMINNKSMSIVNHIIRTKRRKKITYTAVSDDLLKSLTLCHPMWLKDQGFNKDTCRHFGISISSSESLKGRVCFPIDAPDGTIIAISGRLPNHTLIGAPKYKITKNAKANSTLFNLSRVKKNITSYHYIIVVEGFKSVLWLYQNGYPNAVAAIGAALSDEQCNLLLKLGLPIVVITDNDKPGECFGQAVYNKCRQLSEVTIIKLSELTETKKASVDDLSEQEFENLRRKLNELYTSHDLY